MKAINWLVIIFKGMVIGIGNVIPGVSGGTMAVILNIYERLTEAVGNFITDKKNRLKHIGFLLLIGSGVFIGIILFARLFTFLLDSELTKQHTFMFFIGLILGSIPLIFSLHSDMKPNTKKVSLMLAAIAILLLTAYFGGSSAAEASLNPEITGEILGMAKITKIDFAYGAWLFICGIFAAISMVLPGFSGSALLITLGEYDNILYFVDERMVIPVGIVALGAIPGVLLSAKVMSVLLKKFPPQTYYFILGLIIASVVQIFIELSEYFTATAGSIVISMLSLVAGVVASYLLSKIKK